MVTGDNIATAIAISTNAGILREEHYYHVFKGNEKWEAKKEMHPYTTELEEKHTMMPKIEKKMLAAGKSKAFVKEFREICAECRGKMIDGELEGLHEKVNKNLDLDLNQKDDIFKKIDALELERNKQLELMIPG